MESTWSKREKTSAQHVEKNVVYTWKNMWSTRDYHVIYTWKNTWSTRWKKRGLHVKKQVINTLKTHTWLARGQQQLKRTWKQHVFNNTWFFSRTAARAPTSRRARAPSRCWKSWWNSTRASSFLQGNSFCLGPKIRCSFDNFSIVKFSKKQKILDLSDEKLPISRNKITDSTPLHIATEGGEDLNMNLVRSQICCFLENLTFNYYFDFPSFLG